MNFKQSFLSTFNLKEETLGRESFNMDPDLEANFSSSESAIYEDISEEALFLESQQDSFVSHIPPFDFEKVSKNLFRLTILLPGICQQNLNTEVKDNILSVKVSPPFFVMSKDESYENLHKGIFEILKPDRPFEGKFRLPVGSTIKNILLSQGLLQVAIQSL